LCLKKQRWINKKNHTILNLEIGGMFQKKSFETFKYQNFIRVISNFEILLEKC